MRFIKRAFLTAAAMIGTVAACTVNVCAYPATAPNTGDIDNYVIFIVIGVVALLIIGAMVLIPIITGATAGAVTGAAVAKKRQKKANKTDTSAKDQDPPETLQ